MWRGVLLRRSCGTHSTFDVPGSRGAKAQYLAFATELALPAKYSENASFTHNYCANRLILKILTALESIYLAPKLMRSSRYHMIYVARDIAAKKLRCVFNF